MFSYDYAQGSNGLTARAPGRDQNQARQQEQAHND
jgi:hypothetical protein